MLVFAVAVLIDHHVRSSVWLVTALAERKADVTKILRNVFVQRLRLVLFRRPSLDDLLGFDFDLLVGNDAILLQIGVPLPDFDPALEGR